MSLALQIYRNRSTTYQVDLARDGLPLSLDGQTLIFTIARLQDESAASAALRKVSGEGITHSPGVTGRATFTITPAESATLDPFVTYYCDVTLVDVVGNALPVDGLNGTLTPLSVVTAV